MTQDNPKGAKRGLDRRALLLGAAGGAAVAGGAAAGLNALREMGRAYQTPAAVPEGAPAQIALGFQDSRPAYAALAEAPPGAPNILAIILDDVGFADLGCYGSEIRTPHIDALAAGGLRYANFRTCAMCSPTRAAFLTGLNAHSAGVGWLADIDGGYPGYRGDLTHEAATIAETLRDRGWSTLLVGKWHVNNGESTGANGPYHNWPTQRGFERAYWFMGHSTDFFKPSELFDGVAPVEPPDQPDYYVVDDLTDRAILYLRTQRALNPDKPVFLQLAYPSTHSPLQVPAIDRDAYRGAYDAGWDVIRAARLAKQKALGLVPATTQLPPLSRGAEPWDALPPALRPLYARYMEVYAAMMTRCDAAIGRLVATLDELGMRDNTLVLLFSDNGGSAEGTPTGTPNVFAPAFARPVPPEQALTLMDRMGEDDTFPHYPIGWTCASNTPYRLYKQFTNEGGVADPLIVAWPARIAARGEIRHEFVHVVDLCPTLLEAAGVERSPTHLGRPQKPMEGASVLATFTAAGAPTRTEQYFELGGSRAYLSGRWRAVARHERGRPFAEDRWELYDLATDFNEMVDVAAQHPEIVAELAAKWQAAAERYQVLPLDDRTLILKLVQDRQRRGVRPSWDLRPPIERLSREAGPIVCGLDHVLTVELDRPAGADGVLVAQGSKHAGWVLYIHQGRLCYETSLLPWVERIEGDGALPTGPLTVSYRQTMESRPFDGAGELRVGDRVVGARRWDRCLFATGYDGFTVGADLGNQVSTRYRGPNPFPGAIRRVLIEVSPRPFTVPETQAFLERLGLRL